MRPAVLAFCLAFPFTPAARSPAQSDPPIAARGAFFALSVEDLDASTRWYQDALGLSVMMRSPRQNGAAAVALEGGGLIVELIQQDASMPLKRAVPAITDRMQVHGLVKGGVVVADFDATVARLRERHVTFAFGPYPARPGQRANVILEDNAGNLLQIFGQRQ